MRGYEGARIHRSESVEICAVDRDLLAALVPRLERRVAFSLSVTDGQLYLEFGAEMLEGRVERHSLPA